MGLMKRIQRLTTARIETFLSSVEDPEVMFPQLIRELEKQVQASAEAESKAKAAVKHAERDVCELAEKIEYYATGAKRAVDAGSDDMAREAISAQLNAEDGMGRRQAILDRAQQVYEDARSARERMQRQLADVMAKKDEILTRARVAKNQLKIGKTVRGPISSSGSILDAIDRMETKVEEAEAEIEIQREASGKGATSLDEKLDALEVDTEVSERLAALKEKIAAEQREDV